MAALLLAVALAFAAWGVGGVRYTVTLGPPAEWLGSADIDEAGVCHIVIPSSTPYTYLRAVAEHEGSHCLGMGHYGNGIMRASGIYPWDQIEDEDRARLRALRPATPYRLAVPL